MKQNWEIKKLGEVCEINIGRTPERGNANFWDKDKQTNNVWLSIADMNNAINGYVSDSTEYVSDSAVPKMKLVKANTLLMSFKLTIGRCVINQRDLYTNEAIAALPIKSNNLDLFFLKYYLSGFDWNKLTEGDAKVKGRTLNKEKLKDVPVIVPPLSDQHCIVSILDEKFSQIETLKSNAQKNLDNAEQLWKAQMEKQFDNQKWEKKKLMGICTHIVDCPHTTPKKSPIPTEYPCIRTSELKNGSIEWSSMQYLEKDEYLKRITRLEPKENDIVYGREGTFGDAVLLPNTHHFSLGQRTMLFRPNPTLVIPRFLLLAIISPFVYKQAVEKNTGCGVAHVNVADVKNFEIPIPSLAEQERIVKELDTLSAKINTLKANYRRQIECCDELRQSLLKKAFEGEL